MSSTKLSAETLVLLLDEEGLTCKTNKDTCEWYTPPRILDLFIQEPKDTKDSNERDKEG